MLRGAALGLILAGAITLPLSADKATNSLRFAHEQVLNSTDPYYSATFLAGFVADQVWDTLIYRNPNTGAYQGLLATAWRWVSDTTLELDLREGVRFHNGETFDADDVVYTLNYVSNPKNRVFNYNLIRWLDHVEKVGAYRVRLVTKSPAPAAIAFLASPFIVIHPHDHYAAVGPEGVNLQPVGTGPFRVVEHAVGKYLRLARNRDYFKDSPKTQPTLDTVEIRFIPDAQTRVAEVVAGSLDLIVGAAQDQAQQLRAQPHLQVSAGETLGYAFLQLNTLPAAPARELLDVRVRQAIMYAIDREAIARHLVGGGSRVLHAECLPQQFGCTDEGVPRYEFNPSKARQLLAEAGHDEGFVINLYTGRDRNQSEAIVGYLGAVGIRVKLRFLQQSALSVVRRSGRAPLAISETGSFYVMDVAASASYYHEFQPIDSNRDPELRDLLLRGDSTMNDGVRETTYAQALKLIAERAYVLPLYTTVDYRIAARDLVIPDGYPRFNEMYWR